MKKLLSLILILTMLTTTFIACGGDGTTPSKNNATTTDTESIQESEATESEATESEVTESEATESEATESEATESETTQQTEKPSETTTPDLNTYTVSAEQWKDAFIFLWLNANSFTIKATETKDEHVTIEEGKYYENIYVSTITDIVDDVTQKKTDLDTVTKPSQAINGWAKELFIELDDFEDFGYSLFTFSEETLSFSASMELDDANCTVTMAFENQRISKITIKVKTEYEENLESITEFFDYNTTKITDDDRAPYAVDEAAWKTAFDLSSVDNFTVHIINTNADTGTVNTLYGTYKNGTYSGVRSSTTNDNHTDENFNETKEIKDFTEFDDVAEFIRKINNLADCGYSLFKFSDTTFTYEATMEIDIPNVKVALSFENEKITLMTLKGESNDPAFSDVDVQLSMFYPKKK